jgi:PQQ-dependent catabolism-associated beta-propeller protein
VENTTTLIRRHSPSKDGRLSTPYGATFSRKREKDHRCFFLRRTVMPAIARTAFGSVCLALLLFGTNPATAFRAFVSNEKGNSISVVDTDKMETVATIPTGQRPRGIAVSRDGKFVYVALGDDDTIQIFDTKTHENVGELPSGADPEQFALDPAGKRLYVANENDAMVTIIDVDKRLALGQISVGVEPEGMSVSPDSRILVCTSETTSMAHFIDTKTHEIVANVLLGSRPRFSAYKSDGSELWATSEVGGGSRFRGSGPRRSSPSGSI